MNDPCYPPFRLPDQTVDCQALFEAAADAIFLLDDTRFVACNPSTLVLYGCQPEDILGMSPWDISPARQPDGTDSQAKAGALCRRAMEGEPQWFEWQHRRSDGSLFDVDFRLNRVELPGGPRLQAVVREIAGRGQDPFATRDHARRLLTTTGAIILGLDAEGRVTSLNPAGSVLLGRTEAELQGRDWFEDFLPEPARGALREGFLQLVSDKDTPGMTCREYPVLTCGGEERHIRWHDVVLNDADGRVSGMLCSGLDVTDQHRHVEDLRLYERIVSGSNDLISVVGRDYVYRVVNDAYVDAHGRAKEEIVGHSVTDLFGREVFETVFREKLARCFAGEDVRFSTWLDFTAIGRRFMNVLYTPYRDAAGEVGGVIVSARDITEQRLVEEALEASLARNRVIVDTAVDAILAVDMASRIAFANPAACRLAGYSGEELRGRMLTDLMPEHYRVRHQAAFQRYLETGQPRMPWRDLEFMLLHRDGHEIPVEVSIGEDIGTEPRLFIGVLRDMSERRRAEQALEESRDRYRALFVNMMDGYAYCLMLFDDGEPSDFIYLDVNPAFERLTGLKGVVGKRVSQLIPGIRESNPDLFQLYGRVARGGREERLETYVPGLDIWFSLSVYSHEPDHFVAVFENITERMRSLQALEQREERVQLLLDSTAEAIYGVDTEGFCTFVNRSCLSMLGYDRVEDLLGTHIHEIIHHSHADGSPYPATECRAYQAYVQDRGVHVDDEVFWHRDGSAFPVEFWSYPMHSGGQVVGSVVTFLNITDRRLAQERLSSARQMLEQVINTVPLQVFWKDWQLNYLGCNLAFARFVGEERPQDIVGKNDFDLTSRKYAELYRLDDARVMQTEQAKHNFVEPIELPDGSQHWLETSKIPLRDGQGQIVGVLGVFQDITERLQSEERLLQAAKVFESTTDGVVITDAETHIVAVNRAFTEITGYGEAEARGHTPRLLQSGRHDEHFYQSVWNSIKQTGSWSGEIWNRRKGGEVYPEWLNISAVRDEAERLTNYVGVFSDLSQVKRSEEELEQLAHYDPLTGLPNRLLFNARLDHALLRVEREGMVLTLLFIDLDHFKIVNDGLGHPTGDKLLQEVAQRLSQAVRSEDTVARLGGDEFVVALEGLENTLRVSNLAEKLLDGLTSPFEIDGNTIFIGASIGISSYPMDGLDGTTLLKNADAAMYSAKEEGRNTYRFYNAEMTRSARERLTLEAHMRRGIVEQEFILHYQPQVDVASGEIVGVEALVRWDHPTSGLIPPARFIPLAEETGLIVPLGDWVLYSACLQAKAWLEDPGMPPLTMAVNLSPRQFRQADLAAHVRSVLDATELPPGMLELEITESAVMGNAEQAAATLQALKELGVMISIDDFGTGYSSLSYLKRFPIDKLKIDQSFIRDIPQDQSDMEIAATIIAMSRNLRLKVLAEGVETEAQLSFLKAQGCDAYQGFLFSRPVPADVLRSMLETS